MARNQRGRSKRLPPPTPLTDAQQKRLVRMVIEARAIAGSGLDRRLLINENFDQLFPMNARIEADRQKKTIAALLIEMDRERDRDLPGPYWTLLNSRSTSRQKRKAARAIAATMPTKIVNREAYRALKEEQGHRWLREGIYVPALLEAARDKRRPQPVRIGAKWLTDEDGRKASVRPVDGSFAFIRRWLMIRAWAIAAKKLGLGRAVSPFTERERDTMLLAAKKQGVTPDALRKRFARVKAKLAQFQKRWQKG
jgi:hypothetical protein